MKDSIVVYSATGMPMAVETDIAQVLNLRGGQRVSEAVAWEIIGISAHLGIARCQAALTEKPSSTLPSA